MYAFLWAASEQNQAVQRSAEVHFPVNPSRGSNDVDLPAQERQREEVIKLPLAGKEVGLGWTGVFQSMCWVPMDGVWA